MAAALERSVATSRGGAFVFAGRDGERAVAFSDMLASARGLLGALQRRGVEPGDVLLVHVRRPEECVRALWAALLGGLIVTSFGVRPPSFGAAHHIPKPIRRVLASGRRSTMLVSDEAQAAILRQSGFGPPLALDAIGSTDDATVRYAASPDEPRLLVLSSGTTGEPNLVTLSDRALLERWWPRLPAREGAACLLAWSPLDHVMGVAIASPATPRRVHLDTSAFVEQPRRWLDLVGSRGVTHCTMTNFGMKLILNAVAETPAGDPTKAAWDLSSVRRIGIGAEAVSSRVAAEFLAALRPFGLDPDAALEGYGLTECGPVIAGPCRPSARRTGLSDVTPGHALRIVDERGEAADGATGAVEVRGPSMASGYFDDPAATAELLTSDGWIRTGDIGAMTAGALTIVGRHKEIVVVNARKHACRDVEAVAEGVEGVDEAYAAPIEDHGDASGDGRAAFAVFVVTQRDPPAIETTIRRVRHRVARRFGAAPAFVLPIAEGDLPRTALGKVRRLALSERIAKGEFDAAAADFERRLRSSGAAARTPPSGDTETTLAAIFRQLLKTDDFGVEDDFFELGGDSLGGIRLLGEIETRLGRTLTEQAFEGTVSVARLADIIDALEAQPAPPPATDPDRGVDGLPEDVERTLLGIISAWTGVLASPGSLMAGRNLEGRRRPLFWCVQTQDELNRMAEAVGAEQPIYGMRSGYRAMKYTARNVEALAARHVADIRRIDPDGPYWIGGYCQGAYIGVAVARGLQALGKTVALFSIADAQPADVFAKAPYHGRVAVYFGVFSRFNIYRLFTRPELGLQRFCPDGLTLARLPCDHAGVLGRRMAQTLVAAMERDANDAFARRAPPPLRKPAEWPQSSRIAHIRITATGQARAGASFDVAVDVRNRGADVWPPTAASGIALANHWFGPNGETLIWSDGWTPLGASVGAGEIVSLVLSVTAPARPGLYWLEVDMVEEGVAWFKENRSRTAYVQIAVGA